MTIGKNTNFLFANKIDFKKAIAGRFNVLLQLIGFIYIRTKDKATFFFDLRFNVNSKLDSL